MFVVGCTKGGDQEIVNGSVYTVTSQLNGKRVFPALATDSSSGTISGIYDESMNSLSFSLSYRKDSSVIKLDTLRMIRLFKSAAVAIDTGSASRRFSLSTNISAASRTNLTGTFNFGLMGNNGFSASEQTEFLTGNYYLILYSSRFPNGLIGGQMAVTKNP